MNKLLLIFLLGLYAVCHAQRIAPDTYWVQFSDKNGSEFTLADSADFLSERSLERRVKQHIPVDETDLPVSKMYLDSLATFNLTIKNVSKWMNGAVIYSSDTELIDTLHNLGFIVRKVNTAQLAIKKVQPDKFRFESEITRGQVKATHFNQLDMLNGQVLHDLGYNGEGMLIAVMDGGFDHVDEIEGFSHLFLSDRFVLARDFVGDGRDIYSNTSSHGTMVLSLMSVNDPDGQQASAPRANYLLLRTENVFSEYRVEEYNWVSAAEFADSMGADVINVSLGYSLFDDATQNYTYADMDGRTTTITRGAVMASRKGMLVVNSAGNSGDEPWRYITAPSDADSILSIGAVDRNELITSFSSRGPSADGRIKPDVCALGAQNKVMTPSGSFVTGSGTSFSSPVIAGLAACLWQSNPTATCWQVQQAIQMSADRYHHPDNNYGYGIPKFDRASEILDSLSLNYHTAQMLAKFSISPNPVSENSVVVFNLPWLNEIADGLVRIYDLQGRLLFEKKVSIQPRENQISLWTNPVEQLESGVYQYQLWVKGRQYGMPFIKR